MKLQRILLNTFGAASGVAALAFTFPLIEKFNDVQEVQATVDTGHLELEASHERGDTEGDIDALQEKSFVITQN